MRGETLHNTLVFIGEVEQTRLEALQLAAQEASAEGFELCFDEARYWGHNHIVYAAPRHVPQQLVQLVDALEQRLASASFQIRSARTNRTSRCCATPAGPMPHCPRCSRCAGRSGISRWCNPRIGTGWRIIGCWLVSLEQFWRIILLIKQQERMHVQYLYAGKGTAGQDTTGGGRHAQADLGGCHRTRRRRTRMGGQGFLDYPAATRNICATSKRARFYEENEELHLRSGFPARQGKRFAQRHRCFRAGQ